MDYAYANARIKAMKSRLLTRPDIDALKNKPDLDSFIAELDKTPYNKDIAQAGVRFAGIDQVEEALRKNMIASFRKLLYLLKEDGEESLLTSILQRWDVQNIKTILRGIRIHAAPEEILSCLIPAGELDEASLIELSRQPDIKAVIDLLATWGIEYYKPLIRNFKEYTEKRDMAILEYALDMYYYEKTLEKVKRGESDDERTVRDFISLEIDLINIKTILKGVRDHLEPEMVEKFLIRGSTRLGIETLHAMASAGTIEAVIQHLQRTPYQFLSTIPAQSKGSDHISPLEKELDRYLIKMGINHFHRDPLSIAIGLGYIWAKVNEVTNIRIMAWGKTAGVMDKELQQVFIHV
jgi:V/A-type H+-transporting ATPase subunit C